MAAVLSESVLEPNPDPPILVFFFFRFPCILRFPISLAFLCVFPFFSKDFRGSAKRKTLACFGVSLAFFSPKKRRVGGSGNGSNDHFGQNDLIPNRILLAFARPKWTKMAHFGLERSILVHSGPPTVLWPFLNLPKSLCENPLSATDDEKRALGFEAPV